MKRVLIIHGWDGYPDEGWFPWLKKNLVKRGFKVVVPKMPDPAEPKIAAWINHLKKVVGNPDKNTYFVGHSIGCQAIMRYLGTLDKKERIGGAVFVAGWLALTNLETKEERAIARPWLTRAIHFTKLRRINPKFISIFSSNDPFVPKTDWKKFKEKLNSKIIILSRKGHFSGSDRIASLQVVLKNILKISK